MHRMNSLKHFILWWTVYQKGLRPINLCWIWVNSFIKTRNKHFLPVYKCTLFFLRRGRGLVVFINLQILCPSGIKCNGELRTLKSFVFCNFGWIDFFNFSDISLSNTVVSISSLDFLNFSQSLTLSHVLKSSKILVLIWYTLYNIHMTCFWLISTNCKHFVFMFARLIWFTYFLGVGLELGVIVLILGIHLIVLYKKKNRSTKLLKMIINSPVIITGIMTMALVS